MFSPAACISFGGDADFCVTYSAVSYLSFSLVVICNCDTERILQILNLPDAVVDILNSLMT